MSGGLESLGSWNTFRKVEMECEHCGRKYTSTYDTAKERYRFNSDICSCRKEYYRILMI
jgi:hypothetical protein